ncbi:MAG: PQQ-binding-like beta-propeller repeat protein [bacterium]|nr:PQQ-binding-like beta-propeller repeat protein [bacterium]
MRLLLVLSIVLITSLSIQPTSLADGGAVSVQDGFVTAPADWPWWRGPLRNGTAAEQQQPPLNFNETDGVRWKSKVPGRGHGSPTVVGSRVFLATCREDVGSQSLLCFERATGELMWETTVHSAGAMRKNEKSTAASSTPACDGKRVYINFPNDGKLMTTALDLEGQILWQREISNYVVHQGYGASPALYQNLVIVSADNKSGGALVALDGQSGDLVWRRERPEKPNYPSPIILHVNGRDQVVMVGCDLVVSYDPLSGETLWQTAGATTECVTSTLTDGQLVYTSGGYPRNHMSAIKADGSAEVVWENDSRLYVPSLVIKDGYLYGVLDAGIAVCWEAATGKVMWKARLGGTFSSSPVLVGDRVYVTNEGGDFFVFRADPTAYEELAKNKLGVQVFATPIIVSDHIFHRVTHLSDSGERQEWLYCLGE